MRDRLDTLWNAPPRGGVQTAYTRFWKTPWGEIKTKFTESQGAFKETAEGWKKTSYSKLLDGGRDD